MRRVYRSPDYNWVLNLKTGAFDRWGRTVEDNPPFSPIGPEILDLEISAGGDCIGNCPFCYKCNGGDGPTLNMTLPEFQTILDKMPSNLTQIAFGIMNIGTNPSFFDMMEYARTKLIVPNYTMHGLDLTEYFVRRTASLCGAVSVSMVSEEPTFDAVRRLTEAGMRQVNIHFMLSEETYDQAVSTVLKAGYDPRLRDLNAIVFLQYKPKGRSPEAFTPIKTVKAYRQLMDLCREREIGIGFDSCSAPMFCSSLDQKHFEQYSEYIEPCESALFSSYINCSGIFFPCSFMEGRGDWESGLDVLRCDNFLSDIWNHTRTKNWRSLLLSSSNSCSGCRAQKECRSCPEYPITACKGELREKTNGICVE